MMRKGWKFVIAEKLSAKCFPRDWFFTTNDDVQEDNATYVVDL